MNALRPRPPAGRPRRWTQTAAATAIAAAAVSGLAACGSGTASANGDTEIRLGYFPNLTHATPVLGVASGTYQRALGSVKLTTQTFNAGPAAVEAVLSGAVDAAYLGPNPAINAFARSDGQAVRIISGSASGGAQFVVRPDVTIDNLKGRTFATPQLGNTQDVALRYWLKQRGLSAPTAGQGDVNVIPQDNGQSLEQFKAAKIDGGWLPEPWASRLVVEGGGKVLVNEASLWPRGQFVTTHLIVATQFLNRYPNTVKALLRGELDTLALIKADPAASRDAVNAELEKLTGKALAPEVLARAWPNIELTADPIASSLKADQEHAEAVGLAEPIDLTGSYDLAILNGLLKAAGRAPVTAAGLGTE